MLQVTALEKVISSSGNSQHVNLHKELFLDTFYFFVRQSTWPSLVLLRETSAFPEGWPSTRPQLFQSFELRLVSAPWLPGAGVCGLWQEGAQWHLDFLYFPAGRAAGFHVLPQVAQGCAPGSPCTTAGDSCDLQVQDHLPCLQHHRGTTLRKEVLWWLRGFWMRL